MELTNNRPFDRRGRPFEVAVHRFLAALDPSATVLFDHRVPDRDDGKLRQCDAWIEAKLLGHLPFCVLVSCKDYKRKIDRGDIERFGAEVESTRASSGMLCSSAGFSVGALVKARAHGLLCCRFYQSQAADLPETIFAQSFCARVSSVLEVLNLPRTLEGATWGAVFDLEVGAAHNRLLIDVLADEFDRQEQIAVASTKSSGHMPSDWAVEHGLVDEDLADFNVRIRVRGHWKLFEARLEAHLLNGLYCFQDGAFTGSMATPPMDMRSAHPGPGWIERTDRQLPATRILFVCRGGNIRKAWRQVRGISACVQAS